jgi:putative peptide zinc metalloprotease protein
LTIVRARSGGLIRQIRVSSGQQVGRGDVLIVLSNPELTTELADLEAALEQSRLRSRALLQAGEMARYQAEQEVEAGLDKQKREKALQVESLTIRAPHSGSVMARDLHRLPGRYAFPGMELLVVGDNRRKEVRVSVDQQDVDRFWDAIGSPVQVRLPGVGALRGRLTSIAPQASLTVPHATLAATAGGPLAVRPRPNPSDATTRATADVELLTPRFTGVVALSPRQSAHVRAGQRGVVALVGAARPTVGSQLTHWLGDWLRNQTRRGV